MQYSLACSVDDLTIPKTSALRGSASKPDAMPATTPSPPTNPERPKPIAPPGGTLPRYPPQLPAVLPQVGWNHWPRQGGQGLLRLFPLPHMGTRLCTPGQRGSYHKQLHIRRPSDQRRLRWKGEDVGGGKEELAHCPQAKGPTRFVI